MKGSPNQALEPTTLAVTPRAPSSTSRASQGRGSSLTLGNTMRARPIIRAAAFIIYLVAFVLAGALSGINNISRLGGLRSMIADSDLSAEIRFIDNRIPIKIIDPSWVLSYASSTSELEDMWMLFEIFAHVFVVLVIALVLWWSLDWIIYRKRFSHVSDAI